MSSYLRDVCSIAPQKFKFFVKLFSVSSNKQNLSEQPSVLHFFILREKKLKTGDPCTVFPILFHELYHTIFRMFSVSWHDTKQNFACFYILQNDTKRNFAPRFLFHETWKMSRNTNFFHRFVILNNKKFNGKKVLLILPYPTVLITLSQTSPPHNPLPSFPFPTPNPYTVFSF
jgi:hypothetical protein